jgi:hypothetical protein
MYQEPTVPGGVLKQTVHFSLASQSVDLFIGTMITDLDNTHPWLTRYEMIPAGRDFSLKLLGKIWHLSGQGTTSRLAKSQSSM